MTNLRQIRDFINWEKKGKKILLWIGEEVVAKVDIAIDYASRNPRYEYSFGTKSQYFWIYNKNDAADWVIQELKKILRSEDLEEYTLAFEKFKKRNNIRWSFPEKLILMLKMNEAGEKNDEQLAAEATLTFRRVRSKYACKIQIRKIREELRASGADFDSHLDILIDHVGGFSLYKNQFLDLYPPGKEYLKSGNMV
ncbi:hypothetical protein [Paenibacillus ihuae]|uniref:hypothetical protein n=1 Tax=Paenibacillus ihuae TaxID=1232431 RepID=UPI0011DDC655|nr:hypothetical protein [Paenibacillus ihuae]